MHDASATTSNANKLTAAEVNKVISSSEAANRSATISYPVTVSIFELFGRAFIGWSLDPNYAVGNQDVLQLREDTTFVRNIPVSGPSGSADTGHVFGTGLNASYWSFNYAGSAGWRQLVVTPNT